MTFSTQTTSSALPHAEATAKTEQPTRFTCRVKKYLEGAGFHVFNTQNKGQGPVDLIALRGSEVWLVFCSVNGVCSDEQKKILQGFAAELKGGTSVFLASRGAPPHYLIKTERLEAPQ